MNTPIKFNKTTATNYGYRIARFIIRSIAAIACIMVMLWLAKCPGDLEWWRAIGIGFMIPVISRFL